MATERNHWGRTEKENNDVLINEAQRDLVFLMDIENHGEQFQCTEAELSDFMRRAIKALLDSGALIGWGEPGTESWRRDDQFSGSNESVAAQIIEKWKNAPRDYMAMVFKSLGSGEHG